MKIAVFQGSESGGKQAALARIDALAAQAATQGCDLLVLPEMFLTGYAIGAAQVAAEAEPLNGPSAARLAGIARRHRVAVVCGWPERGEVGVFNAATLFGVGGDVLLHHRKTHLFGTLDREMFVPGSEPPGTAPVGPINVGLLICYEVEFPENVRALALRGADLVCVPTALMSPFELCADVLVPARAIENQLFVAYANRIGTEGPLTYCGRSCVAGPDGKVLRAGGEESLLMGEIRPEHLARSRAAMPYLTDRRPELYGL